MQEYVTDAIILKKDPLRDQDGRYAFFTQRFGKITGKATSSRKITSKLSAHLEPGNLSRVRFVEVHGTQIVDALKTVRTPISLIDLHFLSEILPDGEPEPELWNMFATGQFSWAKTLQVLGWDPEGAACAQCNKEPARYFYIPRQEFFCSTCASKLKKDKVILV